MIAQLQRLQKLYKEGMTMKKILSLILSLVLALSLVATLNVSAEELTERFVQGDESRRSEGSGLGLSIAKNLTVLMGGQFDISVDGDLFKATITLPLYSEAKEEPESETEEEEE